MQILRLTHTHTHTHKAMTSNLILLLQRPDNNNNNDNNNNTHDGPHSQSITSLIGLESDLLVFSSPVVNSSLDCRAILEKG